MPPKPNLLPLFACAWNQEPVITLGRRRHEEAYGRGAEWADLSNCEDQSVSRLVGLLLNSPEACLML